MHFSELVHHRSVRYIAVISLLALMAVFQIASMVQETQTIDEGVHLSAGVSYLLTGDFRLNEEHPPLIKMLSGVGVLLLQPVMLFGTPAWNEANQWAFAQDFLYHSGNDADRILLFARLPMVLVSLGLGILIYYVARRIAGELAGVIALGWYVFDPNFIAHGRYVTTDVGAALAYLAVMVALLRLLEHWTRGRLVAFGVVFALAQMTKYSMVFLWIVIVALPVIWYLVYYHERGTFKHIMSRLSTILLSAIIVTSIVTFIFYWGQVGYGRDDLRVQKLFVERDQLIQSGTLDEQLSILQKVVELSDGTTAGERFYLRVLLDTPIPAWSYFKGLVKVISHNAGGHLSYLVGNYALMGWWWYFPVAFLVKTPLATLIMMFTIVTLYLVRRWREGLGLSNHPGARGWVWMLVTSAVLYFVWSMTSKINLGVRHIFPIYPVLFILIGLVGAKAWAFRHRVGRSLLILVTAAYCMSSVFAFPTYLAYFSEAIGGSSNGPTYLVDSNIDWGQDVKRLKTYMQENNIPFVCMSYFGQANLEYYGIDYRYLPNGNDPHSPADVDCVVAISVTSLLSKDGIYWWLREYEPDARIGGSIYVYDFRGGRTPTPAD